MIKLTYRISSNYPSVNVDKNIVSASRLLNIYASSNSELSLFLSMLFQISTLEDKEIKEVLKNILLINLKHLELLGLTIKNLGLMPLYLKIKDGVITWFSSKNINYVSDKKTIILDDIYTLKILINKYKLLETEDKNLESIINRIILEKEIHLEILEKILKEYEPKFI